MSEKCCSECVNKWTVIGRVPKVINKETVSETATDKLLPENKTVITTTI